MKLYSLDGSPTKDPQLLEEFSAAREIGVLRIGESALFFRVRLRQYYIPFSEIRRVFRRVYAVPANVCCGKGNLEIENLVIQGEERELAQIQLPGTRAAREAVKELKSKLPDADFSTPPRKKTPDSGEAPHES